MFNNSVRRAVSFALCAALAAPASAQEKNAITTQYGDIHISHVNKMRSKGDLSGVEIMGTETEVRVPYPRSHSLLIFHADDIVTKSEGKDQFAHATLTGNVRYTMTQYVRKDVTRIVTGTAARAVFNHDSERLEMDGNVHVSLTDPVRLALPGTIRGGHVVVEMDESPYLYTLTGPAAGNAIDFTPKQDAPKQGEKPNPRGIGAVHVSGYDKGAFQIGQQARFEGDGTVLVLHGVDALSVVEVRAPLVEAAFLENHSALKNAKASGGATYSISRPEPKEAPIEQEPADQKTLLDTVTGRSDTLEYRAGNLKATLPGKEDARFTLAGHVDADITAPGSLQAPAKIKVDRLIAHIAKPYSYEMKSAARDGLIRLAPLPPKPKPAQPGEEPKKPRFALGVVTVSRFDYGVYAPGNSLHLTTAQGKISFVSEAAETQTETRLLARDILADIAPENYVTMAKARGDVEFRAQQLVPKTKIMQTLTGTSPELDYAADVDTRKLTVTGPFLATTTVLSRVFQTGKISGASHDKLIATLTGDDYYYEIESPDMTAEGDIILNPPKPKTDAKPAPGKKSAATGKKISER